MRSVADTETSFCGATPASIKECDKETQSQTSVADNYGTWLQNLSTNGFPLFRVIPEKLNR
jgi:hypothetical protein